MGQKCKLANADRQPSVSLSRRQILNVGDHQRHTAGCKIRQAGCGGLAFRRRQTAASARRRQNFPLWITKFAVSAFSLLTGKSTGNFLFFSVSRERASEFHALFHDISR
jgi:hypothetical protein